MRLNVNKLLHTPGKREEFHFTMDLSDLTFGGMHPVSRPVAVDGVVRNEAGVLLCELTAQTTLCAVCDRCLTEFDLPKSASYACILAEEKQFDDNEEIVLLEDDTVDLAALARTAFILAMDMKILCSPDCKGLCGGCGANLNAEPCRCKKETDPRLMKLASLLER
ncbi:MAG: DUF177 domain-containing protein [Oscillospiraceae bacterium]|nr:DUF177 domain-containing protein [Oscillospiraceae bacterium]